MASLRDIQRRIKSVKNTQQITKAMKMVSAAKLRRAQEDITAARPYAEKMEELVKGMAGRCGGEGHPLMAKYRGGKTEVLLMTSDRGLCGSFNAGLLRKTEALMREVDGEVRLNLVGRKAAEYFKRSSLEVTARRSLGAGRPTYDFAAAIASAMIDSYLQGEIGEVYMVYSVFRSALTQVPTAQRVLPLSTEGEEEERAGAGEGEYLFEPSEADVLESLLRKYVEVQVFRALLETAASEHGARMTAMDSASKNASEMIASLTLTYNRLRQAAITTELMEIIGGAEALKG